LSDGDASQIPYVPNGKNIFIAASTTYLRAVRYCISIGKKFILYSENDFRILQCSIATLNGESLAMCLT